MVDLPSSSCRKTGTCPANILFRGSNQSLGEAIARHLFPKSFTRDSSDILTGLAQDALLKVRYGGSYVLTMTTPPTYEEHVENMVRYLSPKARRIYQISGTQKFKLPKDEVRTADVFQAVENAKSWFTVQAWGLADTTLEDVFIKVAREAEALNVLS